MPVITFHSVGSVASIKSKLPGPLASLLRVWTARLSPRRADAQAWTVFREDLRRVGRVRSGPFEGMDFGSETSWGKPWPLLIGSYEAELQPAIDAAVERGYERIIDIGCAEGYYAVGLAQRLQQAEVFAFDIDDNAQQLCRQMADRNGVGHRVHIDAECTHTDLEALVTQRTLVISDCEGAEKELLDPKLAPCLALADMIVELHDFVDPSISETIIERFSETHQIQLVDHETRVPSEFPIVSQLSLDYQRQALDENRPSDPNPMQWAILQSKSAIAHASR